MAPADPLDTVRLDIWLDVACLYRTRSEAQKACRGGKVVVDRQSAKPHRLLKVGDEVVLERPSGRKQRVVVRTLVERHVSKVQAREMYEDLTPPPTPQEIETRRLDRMYRAATPPHAPDKRQRRALRRLKGRED